MKDEAPQLLRTLLIAALKAREDKIAALTQTRAPVSQRADGDDPDSDLWWARHDGRKAAEMIQDIARQGGDVHLLGLTTMFLMELDAVEERESEEERAFNDRSFTAEQERREKSWKYTSVLRELCDRYLADPATSLTLDRWSLIAIIDESAAQLPSVEVDQLHKYIDRPERRLWLRDRMVESLRDKFSTGSLAATVEDAQAAATEQLPNLHKHMAKHLRTQIGRAIEGLPPKRDRRQWSAKSDAVAAEVPGQPQHDDDHDQDAER